jgi:hypothetical protein
MKNIGMVSLLALSLISTGFGASKPPIPQPEPNFTDPGTPEARRAYKIAILENEIAQDEYLIANPGSGKATVAQESVKVAKKNLKLNQEILAKVKAGADMEVYFCSLCGREMMKDGNCPHCKMMKGQKTVPLFDPHKGNPRPSAIL